jgi:hypothetical protein
VARAILFDRYPIDDEFDIPSSETNRQTERLNQCLEAFLRCSIHATRTRWSKWLPPVEYWYNTSYHSALKRSPFETLYGHVPRHFGTPNPVAATAPELEEMLQARETTMALLRQQLLHAQDHMRSRWETQFI